ncbi:MAG: glycosyltransferase family 2 protein [Gammaproteobacteria bacterium]|jgi:glycosyltransferase involved in cell wall biosynthesis|nr:glycosyltransferase family 2 protein [Pseudomonadales bacterium]MBT5718246.1 glycosyltransferase family 2 protein [Gammaproteobacteria bacterium]MBT6480588.1 glycosyltransferase family 2 protein [Gammaproteobacteria bacterium]MBT7225247.1 glycosyltransferase family 2 protein [Gammaproteobacteria bacterium]
MSNQTKIAVLLSTYNGERFLGEQLNSLLAQSYSNFILVVRDDGSSDGTVAILEGYALANPGQIHLLPRDDENKGASGGFAFLIDYVLQNKTAIGLESAYMMFCDQDDTWFPDKIEKQVAAMIDAEADGDSAQAVLVHSDLEVVSEQNTVIAKSLIRYQGLEIERNSFENLVISNLVTGCTALINEALAAKALPIAANAIMHDWWLGLIAAAFGRIVYMDMPLVHYRQHGNNTIGAKEFTKVSAVNMSLWRRILTRKPNDHLVEVAIQAAEFRRCYGAQLSARQRLSLRLCSGMGIKIGIVQRLMYRLARRF